MQQLSFKQFVQILERSPNQFVETLTKILIESSLNMERQAKINATTYPKVRTGRLRSSINGLVDSPMGSPRIVLRAGGQGIRATQGPLKGVSNDVYYAEDLELGLGNIKTPRYYLKRARDKEIPELQERLQTILNKAMV
jgi:hypothetical protein